MKFQTEGVLEIDVHGKTKHQAKTAINARLSRAGKGVYRVRVIHGYRNGTELRDMIRKEYAVHPKVLRIVPGINPGETDLVLRELY